MKSHHWLISAFLLVLLIRLVLPDTSATFYLQIFVMLVCCVLLLFKDDNDLPEEDKALSKINNKSTGSWPRKKMKRFQVFTSNQKEAMPVFSAPWYWICSWFASIFCVSGDYCRIVDTKLGKSMMEWARANPSK